VVEAQPIMAQSFQQQFHVSSFVISLHRPEYIVISIPPLAVLLVPSYQLDLHLVV